MNIVEGAVNAVSSIILGEKGTKDDLEKENRFKSFAPERTKCHVRWYVDGKDYFYAVSEAIMSAKKEIFIEDWWLSPELYLRRPPSKNENFRLDRLLKAKAEQGVKIYVVVYKEMEQALTLDSRHSKTSLQGLHQNIVVQRHPDHFEVGGTIFWAHHEKIAVVDRQVAFIGGLDLCFGRYDTGSHQLVDFHESSKKYSVWPGQDYSNPRIKDFLNVKQWALALIDKKQTARMPWHDVSIGLVGRPVLDVARHFIQRWNFIKKEKAENRIEYPVLIAKSDQRSDHELPPKVRSYKYSNNREVDLHPHEGTCDVQIIRSSAKWSHGLDEVEHSIQNAYIKIIEEAKHFIYIENQFFITATKTSNDYPVKNLIGKAIVDRILKAHKNKEQFRIIVAMPLLPAFPADLDSSDAGTVRLVIHYQYQSICRGGHSILEVLKANGVEEPEKYIGFYSLRTYDKINVKAIEEGLGLLEDERTTSKDKSGADPAVPQAQIVKDPSGSYVTEELYIHTKLLIADDRIVICGSANLNDRSQNGDHDSEIAAVIEDKNYIDSKMAGKDWKAGRFSATLRRHIFKEHLGLLNESDHEKVTTVCYPPPLSLSQQELSELSKYDEKVIDPASDEFYYNTWEKTATTNTAAFRKVFHCTPDEEVLTMDQFKKFIPDRSRIPTGHVCDSENLTKDEIEAELSKIKGHLVHFPLKFLSKEKLSGSVVFDSITPMELFT